MAKTTINAANPQPVNAVTDERVLERPADATAQFHPQSSTRLADGASAQSAPPVERVPMERVPAERVPVEGAGQEVPPRRKGFNWIPLAILAALFAGGFFLMRRANKPAAPAANAAAGPTLPTVRVVPVSVGAIEQTLQVTGALKSNQNIDLGSKIAGRVAKVLVNEGDRVTRGQLLIQLDDADLRAQVAQAQAALNQATVRYRQGVVGLPAREQQVSTGIVQAQTNLRTAQARLRQAQLNEAPRITGAQSGLQTARETVRTAQSRLAQARETALQTQQQTTADIARAEAAAQGSRAALADVIRGARDQQVAQAQAQVRLASANLNDAQTELNRQKILVAGGAAPQSAVDAAQTRFAVMQANLETARQALSLTREGATTEQVTQAREAVRQAEAGVATARTGRSRVLVAQGEVTNALAALAQSQAGLRTAQADLAQIPTVREETRVASQAVDQARSGLVQAQANRSQIPVAREDVNAAQAGIQAAQATLQQAQVNLGYAKIYSPVNGVVNQKLTNEGQTAGQGAALLNLVSLDRVYFEAQVSENNIGQVKAGQPAKVSVAAVSNKPLDGFVTDVIPTADARTRQFRVRISIPKAPRELTPGAFARATLSTQTVKNALIVPDETLGQSGGENFLLLAMPQSGGARSDRAQGNGAQDRKPQSSGAQSGGAQSGGAQGARSQGKKAEVKRRVVQIGINQGGRTQITGGVQAGDQVIIGNTDLQDGDDVIVAK